MKKIVFYWCDWKESPDLDQIRKGMEAVFNGRNLPHLITVPDPQWDQTTIGICSEKVDARVLNRLFLDHVHDNNDNMTWFYKANEGLPPRIFSID
jgi:hypothetical protein